MDKQEFPPLSDRQKHIFGFIKREVEERGFPPTVREICTEVKLKSPSSVHNHLKTLEDRGYIKRDPSLPRAIEILDSEPEPVGGPTKTFPLVGSVAAGFPLLAEQNIDDYITLPISIVGQGDIFALKVRGESMIEAGIMHGDTVIVRKQNTVEQGEICVAIIDDSATVKYFRKNRSGQFFLDPANEKFESIPFLPVHNDASIIGKVVAVLRKI